jgi:hypothetical protein
MTFFTIKSTAVFLASALLCIAAPVPGFAQDRSGTAASGGDVSRLLTQAETQLSELEQATKGMESTGVVTAETAVTFGDVLTSYAETMHQATDAALKGAALAAETKGRSGSVEQLATFEKVAKDHEVRTAAMQKRLAAISEKMSAGSIKTVGFGPELRDLFDRLNRPIVAPAEAALAIPALAPCIAQNWVQCAIQIAKAIPAAAAAWASYQSCMNNPPAVPAKPSPPSNKPWYSYPFRYAQYLVQLAAYNLAVFKHNTYQAGCVVTFVAKIA